MSGPDRAPLQAVLARHRTISAGLLALLVVLAWLWLLSGAGTGMAPIAEWWSQPAPHRVMAGMAMAAGPVAWSASRFLLILAMWWIMMAAMMLPSAAPMILLFGRAAAHRRVMPQRPATAAFLAGYLMIWGLFSLGATVLQLQLGDLGLVAPTFMASTSRWLNAAVLMLAGIYQLTPLKEACLSRCRNPAQFLSRHFRPGQIGALRMGLLHGAFCVGCCWLLMGLLFIGGVMNLAWIAVLSVIVALEKLMPQGRWIATGIGAMLIIGAAVTLAC